jgi:hypothetical protein
MFVSCLVFPFSFSLSFSLFLSFYSPISLAHLSLLRRDGLEREGGGGNKMFLPKETLEKLKKGEGTKRKIGKLKQR